MPARRRYSSVDGCCICGTNSSSEPFVKPDKVSQNQRCLDDIFKSCFELGEKRNGEWCTSCKEIAKKWLRTSKARRNSTSFKKIVDSKRKQKPTTTRHRSKSTDVKSEEDKKELENGQKHEVTAREEENIEMATEQGFDVAAPVIEDTLSEDENEDEIDDNVGLSNSPAIAFDSPFDASPLPDGTSFGAKKSATVGTQTTFLFPTLTSPQANANKLPFIDLSRWRQEEICCGAIFRGPNGEVLVDPKWLRPSCSMCNRSTQAPTPVENSNSEEISIFDEKLASLCS